MSSKNLINGNQKLLNVSKAAKLLSVSPKTIRRWAQGKKLNGLKVGLRGDWRFTKDNLLDMVKPNESTHDFTVGVSSLDQTSSGPGKPTTLRSGFYRDKKKDESK